MGCIDCKTEARDKVQEIVQKALAREPAILVTYECRQGNECRNSAEYFKGVHTRILPYFVCRGTGTIRRPDAYETSALPLSYPGVGQKVLHFKPSINPRMRYFRLVLFRSPRKLVRCSTVGVYYGVVRKSQQYLLVYWAHELNIRFSQNDSRFSGADYHAVYQSVRVHFALHWGPDSKLGEFGVASLHGTLFKKPAFRRACRTKRRDVS